MSDAQVKLDGLLKKSNVLRRVVAENDPLKDRQIALEMRPSPHLREPGDKAAIDRFVDVRKHTSCMASDPGRILRVG